MSTSTSTSSNIYDGLSRRIASREAKVGIIGLGYVGLPLAGVLHGGGLTVLGFDTDHSKIEMLSRGECYLQHLGPALTDKLAASDRFAATGDFSRLAEPDVLIVCVPTPLSKHREPDLSFVISSARAIGACLRPGQLVVLESTTYPGTTREAFLPAIQSAYGERGGPKLEAGQDFFVGFSPEREDPGRASHETRTIPKLVGGLDEASTHLAVALYEVGIQSVIPVKSAEIAEAAKLLENIFRAVNIAMVNEFKLVLARMDIDVWDVIDAAATKPFGFMPFYPGPGLGGHCIPIDPFYLAWRAREVGETTRFIELAGEVNRRMPEYVVDRIATALNDDGKAVRGSEILVLGLAYKPNVADTRETPAAEIISLLHARGGLVRYHDPHVPEFPHMREYKFEMRSVPLDATTLASADCVVVVTDHDAMDWALVGTEAKLVVDTRNALAQIENCRARVVKA